MILEIGVPATALAMVAIGWRVSRGELHSDSTRADGRLDRFWARHLVRWTDYNGPADGLSDAERSYLRATNCHDDDMSVLDVRPVQNVLQPLLDGAPCDDGTGLPCDD